MLNFLSVMDTLEALRYPIGKFEYQGVVNKEPLEEWIMTLEQFPEKLSKLVRELPDDTLDTLYRPGGWTIRQVVHHLSDSHHNSYTRFKWTLTEDKPVIKAYYEDRWATLFDTKTAPIQPSLDYLKALHYKLTFLIRGLSETQLNRIFIHPETKEENTLLKTIGHYVWHGNHHYAHIENALKSIP